MTTFKTSKSTYIYTLLAFITFIGYQLVRGVIIDDEPWLFTAALNISNGLIQHRDFSVVVPPLFYTVYAIPLIFCESILVFRITTAIVEALIVFFTLKIFEQFKINPIDRMLFTFVTIYIIQSAGMVEYNVFSEMLLIIGLYICFNSFLNKQDFWIATIICALILTKHTTGTFLGFSLFIAYLIVNKPKKDRIIKVITICFIYAGIFIAYLLATGSFVPFLEQCVFSISSFTHRSSLTALINSNKTKTYIMIAATMFALFGNLMAGLFQKNDTAKALFVVNLFNIIVIYPICNMYHAYLVMFMDIISIGYLLHILELNTMELKISNLKFYYIFFALMVAFVGMYQFDNIKSSYYGTVEIDSGSKYYQGARVDAYYRNRYKDIIDYINEHEENRYYIIENCGTYISLNCNIIERGYMVQFLNGNIGRENPTDVVIGLSQEENAYVGIYNNDDDVFWQTDRNTRQYIKDNFTFIETIGCIDIYRNDAYPYN